ncbi:MAG: DUF2970 domain-containing protein [Pseudomonadota bacterium]
MHQINDDHSPEDDSRQNLSFWQVLGSTLAAAFGVQSSRNRERDFTHGKASHFILMGIGFTVVFVLLMVALVSAILP